MKRSNYLLKIENPCPESWDAMTPTDSGRFCANCAKNVIDFTDLSDDQVLALVKKSQGSLCGRLEESQMNRYLASETEPSNKARFFRLLAGLFLLSATESQAQELIERKPLALVKAPTEQEKFDKETRDNPHYAQKIWLKGRVISAKTEEPVASAYILPRGSGRTALTDKDGYFRILLPDSMAHKENRFIIFHHQVGQVNIITTADKFPEIIELSPLVAKKVISGGRLTVVKRKWWQRRRKDCK